MKGLLADDITGTLKTGGGFRVIAAGKSGGLDYGMRTWVTDPAGTSLGHMKILVRRNWQLGNLKAELHWGRS